MLSRITHQIKSYIDYIKAEGLYWTVIHRLYKFSVGRIILSNVIPALRPDFLIVENNKFYIDKTDTIFSLKLLLDGKWEEYQTGVFKKQIKKNDVVLDIGAQTGYYTLLAASIVGKNGRVFAFEPDPRNFAYLKKNVEANGYTNVELINKALSDKNQKGKLYINKKNTGDHRMYDSQENRDFVEVDQITLDEYFKNKKTKVNFIQMDIQGFEPFVLRGAKKLLEANKDIALIVEFWPKGLMLSGTDPKDYLSLLTDLKFSLYNIDEVKRSTEPINAKTLLQSHSPSSGSFTNLLCKKI